MLIFWCLYLWLAISSLSKRLNHGRAVQTILSAFGVWLVLALRSPYCGVDLLGGGYLDTFVQMTDKSWDELSAIEKFEPGWSAYCKLCSYITNDPQMFLAITAAITVGPIAWMIYRYAHSIFLAFVVYVSFGLYLFAFSGIRQALALSITFFASHFVLQKKHLFLFVILVLLASLIHSSAIIFLIAWSVSYIRLTKWRGICFLGALFILLPLLSSIVQFLAPIIFGRDYLGYQDEGGAINLFLLYALLFALSLTVNMSSNYLRWMLLFAMAGQSLGTISSSAMTRIAYYFSIYYILFFPEYLSHFKTQQVRYLLTGIISILFIIFFYLASSGGYLNVVPYHFFWEPGYTF